MNRQAEQRHGILSGLNWKWIPLEAVALNLGLNVSLNLWLRITERLLYLSVAFLAGVLLLSTLISWRLILRFEEVPSLRVSHGILLGIVANVFYLGWTVMTAPEQPYRSNGSSRPVWSYEALGPFEFDRAQYELAVAELKDIG